MLSYRRIFTALLCTPVVLPLTAAIATDLHAFNTADELFAALGGMESTSPGGSPDRVAPTTRPGYDRANPVETGDKGTVRFGDTLESIASRYGLSVDQLMRLNPNLDQTPLVVGRRLQVENTGNARMHNLISLRPSGSGGVSWPDTPDYAPRPNPSPSGKTWILPAKGIFTSGYGWRWGRMHKGIDIASGVGTPIVAAQDGQITFAGWNDGGYGYLVEITHGDGSRSLYAHQSRILVREGDVVRQGQQIGQMGSTGRSTGPHLHFEIHAPGLGAVNPMALIQPAA
jgi:murein DD-endopeptidase MepM/ murein hydrolase activator NlpD